MWVCNQLWLNALARLRAGKPGSFVHSLIHWFSASLIHWSIHSVLRWFTNSFIHWVVDPWFIHSDSLIHWFLDWLIDWLIGWLIGWLVDSSSDSLIHCFVPSSVYWFINSAAHWFIDSLVPWFFHSVVHGFFHVLLLASQPPVAHSLMHLTTSRCRRFCISQTFL